MEAKLPRDEQTKACATKAVFRDVKMAFNYPTCRDKIERLMGQPSELPLVQLDELQRSLVALLTTPKYVANTRGLKKKKQATDCNYSRQTCHLVMVSFLLLHFTL